MGRPDHSLPAGKVSTLGSPGISSLRPTLQYYVGMCVYVRTYLLGAHVVYVCADSRMGALGDLREEGIKSPSRHYRHAMQPHTMPIFFESRFSLPLRLVNWGLLA
jgi:hypothetical protein